MTDPGDGAGADAPSEAEFLLAELDRRLEWWSSVAGTPRDHRPALVARLVTGLLERAGAWPDVVERSAVADAAGDTTAALRMAWRHARSGDEAGFEQAMGRAAERGHLGSMWWLARHHRDSAREQEARQWEQRYQRGRRAQEESDPAAAERGDPAAACRVVQRLLEEAREWRAKVRDRARTDDRAWLEWDAAARAAEYEATRLLQRAAEAGSADAAARLGDALHGVEGTDRERGASSLRWYRLADQLGHPHGSHEYGMILYRQGNAQGAVAALRRAESRGDPGAASSLALVLNHRRDPDHAGAEAAHRRAAALGYDGQAWAKLAMYLEKRGDLAGAEAARRSAVDAGEDRADWQLATFRRLHPEFRPPAGRADV